MNRTNFGGSQAAPSKTEAALISPAPPPAPAAAPSPSGRALSPFAWVNEDSRIKHRIFLKVEARRARGVPVNKSLRHYARQWAGRAYRAAPGRQVRASFGTLRRQYYAWRKSRAPHVLRFEGSTPSSAQRFLADFLSYSQCAGVVSFTGSWRCLREASVQLGIIERTACFPSRHSFARLLSRLPRSQRQALKEHFMAQSQAWRARKRLAKAMACLQNTATTA